MYLRVDVNYRLLLLEWQSILNLFDSFVVKYWDTKFHENLSSLSRVVPCGRKDGRTWRS